MNADIERAARAAFEVGRSDAHGPDIYEEQADWWEEVSEAAFRSLLLSPSEEAVEAMLSSVGWGPAHKDDARKMLRAVAGRLGITDELTPKEIVFDSSAIPIRNPEDFACPACGWHEGIDPTHYLGITE